MSPLGRFVPHGIVLDEARQVAKDLGLSYEPRSREVPIR